MRPICRSLPTPLTPYFTSAASTNFPDGKKTGEEFARVVKPGGTILYGDESVGPWLRDIDFGKIVTTNNPLFAHKLPLESIPGCARDVNVRWIMANCFYVITFKKGRWSTTTQP